MLVKFCNVLTTLSFTHDPGSLPYSNYTYTKTENDYCIAVY